MFEELEGELKAVQQKSKPEHWAEIYVERDRACIKQDVLNRDGRVQQREQGDQFGLPVPAGEQIRQQPRRSSPDSLEQYRMLVGEHGLVDQHHQIAEVTHVTEVVGDQDRATFLGTAGTAEPSAVRCARPLH